MVDRYDVVVIGAGLIGSATALHLSRVGGRVAVIGPAEPESPDWRRHHGVFASHYDQGRITRGLDADPLWSELAMRSIERYQWLEEASGTRFHHACGALQVGPTPTGPDDYIARTEATARDQQVTYDRYSGAEFRSIRPELEVPADYTVLAEPAGLAAGYVNPRELVAAQLAVATHHGATLIRATAALDVGGDGVTVRTNDGRTISAPKAVVAAGAWSTFLPSVQLDLTPTPRTVVLARLDQREAERLKEMPSIVFYAGMTNPALTGVYVLPPIRYPDGHVYLKIGGKLTDVESPTSGADLNAWFHTEGSDIEADAIRNELLALVPGLRAEAYVRRPCVVTLTESGHPIIEEVVEGRVVAATGGGGAAAKSCHEIGRRAAELVQAV